MAKLNALNALLTCFCFSGLGLSIYAFIVEKYLEQDRSYQPMCDINEHMSCSKAFSSEYGKGFGIFKEGSIFYHPNSLFGILFYSLLTTLAQASTRFTTTISLVLIILSNITSIYFAYILYFILHDFCVVCVSTYAVNFINLILTMMKYNELPEYEEIEYEEKEQEKVKTT